MQRLEFDLVNLADNLEEERLLDVQYQILSQNLVSKNLELQATINQLKFETKELTNEIKPGDKGQKRKTDLDDIPPIPSKRLDTESPVTSTADENLGKNPEIIISRLRNENSKLLKRKEEFKRKHDNCYKYYVEIKKRFDSTWKNLQEFKLMTTTDLMKDPRITSMIFKGKEKELNELREKNQSMLAELNSLKKEKIELEKRFDQQKEGKIILENSLRTKEIEIASKMKSNKEYCIALNVSKNRLLEVNQNMETLTKKNAELEQTAQDQQKLFKDIKHEHGLETMKIINEHEQKMAKLIADHTVEKENLINEFNAEKETFTMKIERLENESIKFKKIYLQYSLECQKHIGTINSLSNELSQIREKYSILNECNQLLKDSQKDRNLLLQKLLASNNQAHQQNQILTNSQPQTALTKLITDQATPFNVHQVNRENYRYISFVPINRASPAGPSNEKNMSH